MCLSRGVRSVSFSAFAIAVGVGVVALFRCGCKSLELGELVFARCCLYL